MRILQIGLSKNIGGIETFVMRYFREMVKIGICFDFVDIYGDGIAFENEIKTLGGKIYTSPNYKRHPLKAKKYIYQVMKNNDYNCVHIHMLSAANLIPLYAAKKAKVISIVHSHNNNTQGIKKILHRINKYKVLKIADFRLSCGKEAGEWFYGKSAFEIIPNAIEANKFTFSEDNRRIIREKMGLSQEDFVIGFVGRLSHQKNPLYLVDIMKALNITARNNVKLLIVGDGDLRIKLEEYAKGEGVFNNIIFAGLQSEISMWYSAMDCLVLPSLFEGFVIVGVEAQANGLKCFMSDNVPHEINITGGVEFLPLDHNGVIWGDRIGVFMNNMGLQSRETNKIVDTVYDISVGIKQLYNVYQEAQNIRKA